jgi:hypothetical protein
VFDLKKDGAPVPGSPGLQAISFNSSPRGLKSAQGGAKFPCKTPEKLENMGKL